MNKALYIGINYIGTNYELGGCINDANKVAKLTWNYVKPDRKLFLTDRTQYKPTKSNIEKAFQWLRCAKCSNKELWKCSHGFNHSPGTTLYFSISSHGTNVIDTDNDEKDGLDEAIFSLDAMLIADDYIFSNLIYPIPKDVRLWAIMDCCHSATAMDLQYSLECKDSTVFVASKNNEKICKGDVIMISGCKDDQTSADFKNGSSWAGALTTAIDYVLEKYPKAKIPEFLYQLKSFMEREGFTQRPILSFGKSPNLSYNFLSTR